MVEAERHLLANALLDFSNRRFVLLSESCIPLFNFKSIYNYLIRSTASFVESYDQLRPVGRGRYDLRMRPYVTRMAEGLPVIFKKYCKPTCYSDEHYLPTMITKRFPWKNSNRTLTWVDWSRGGPHPVRFVRTDITPEMLTRMRRDTRCLYNRRPTRVCHLFARKFTVIALDRLMRFAPKIMEF
ncbi:hypothetical protein CDL12_13430 [Handroanthus impetiginosus]|uniref:Uncharacterized protein n=1 Tax=Handroanthus impetiginosus TaxID=429701 RepID=A0A2G9H8V0_9LAMI|nr:hypothetical protein CDL12_13430 [Handroanthus impetiginosus]